MDSMITNKINLSVFDNRNVGVLLHSEPGTGETALIRAIANYLNYSVRIVDMQNIGTIETIEQFSTLFNTSAVYVLENIDCVKDVEAMCSALDSIMKQSGCVIIATTNNIDRVDPSLMKEGRLSLKIELGKFDEEETRNLLALMFKDYHADELSKLKTAKLASGVYTPAKLVEMAAGCSGLVDMLDRVVVPS